jgi:CubicO group peptidase (beta-lactamase class C family)
MSTSVLSRQRRSLVVASLFSIAGCRASLPPTPATPARAGFITRLDGARVGFDEIDSTVRRHMDAARVAGLAIAVINDGRVAYTNAYGWKDVARRQPLGRQTVMYGASFTKAAFAYLVMQLVDDKLIDLDRPIERYLHQPLAAHEMYRDLAGDPRAARITARMLLSHTAGFANYRRFMPGNKLEIYFEPGTRYAYSGEGINLLALVVEEITGRSVDALMDERVFSRFGMTRTGMLWRADFAADVASGHDREGRPLGHSHRSRASAAGSMDTTVDDFAQFLAGVLAGTGLSPAARSEMLRPQIEIRSRRQFPSLAPETTDDNRAIGLAYGLGWGLFESRHGKAFFKEGHDDGWENHAVCFEARRTCLVLMSNSANGEHVFMPLLEDLLGDRDTPWRWEDYVPYDLARSIGSQPSEAARVVAVLSRWDREGPPDLRAVVVRRQGAVLAERYFNGERADTLHDVRSAGKSVTSLLVGAAIERGYIHDLRDLLGRYLPEAQAHPAGAIPLQHLLTMRSGLEADDDDPKSAGNEDRMEESADPLQFAVAVPLREPPGQRYVYNSLTAYLAGLAVERAASRPLDDFAREVLFTPLGITDWRWTRDRAGHTKGQGNLFLTARDFAKLGQVVLDRGVQGDRRVLPAGWIAEMLEPRVPIAQVDPYADSYGYFWYTRTHEIRDEKVTVSFASGNGGNKIYLVPSRSMVVAITASAYGRGYGQRRSQAILKDILAVLPAQGEAAR